MTKTRSRQVIGSCQNATNETRSETMERRQKLTGKQNITVTFNDSPHHVRQSGSGIQGISRILEIFFFLNPRILSFGIRNSVRGIPNPANDWKPEFLKFTKLRSQLDCHIMWHYLACKSYVNKHQLKCYQPHLPELCLSFRVAVKTNSCSLKRHRVVHCSSLACFFCCCCCCFLDSPRRLPPLDARSRRTQLAR